MKSIFYDTKSDTCYFTLDGTVLDGTPIANAIKQAALATISQFELFNFIYHGVPMDK